MSEIKKLYTDPFEVEGTTFRVRKIQVFEFAALKQVFASASNSGDILQLAKVYQQIISWLEFKSTGEKYLPVFDGKDYILTKMNNLHYADKVVTAILQEVIPVLFQSTAE